MIVFYTSEKPTVKLSDDSICEKSCSSNCIKVKSKCCNKYKKKGINCKRCPHILLQEAS